MSNTQILDVCQICNQVIYANVDAVETPDGWAHHSCLKFNDGEFHMTGFKHIQPSGIARLYQELDSYGTVGMLWEMGKGEMTGLILEDPKFDYQKYIKHDPKSQEFDDELMEIHDELTEAISMVIYGFSNMINTIKLNTRAMYNMSAVLNIELIQWVDKEVSLSELHEHCAKQCAIEMVNIIIRTVSDGYCNQEMEFSIGNAEEFQAVEEIYCTLDSLYDKVTITLA